MTREYVSARSVSFEQSDVAASVAVEDYGPSGLGSPSSDIRFVDSLLSSGGVSSWEERAVFAAAWFALAKAIVVACGLIRHAGLANATSPIDPSLSLTSYVAFAGVGAVLVMVGRPDRAARFLGALFLLLALASVRGETRALSSSTGGLIGGSLLVHLDPLIPLCVWLFAREFPCRADQGWTLQVASVGAHAAAVAAVLLLGINIAAVSGIRGIPQALLVGSSNAYWAITFGLTGAAFPYLGLRCWIARGSDRSRALWMALSLFCGLAPLVIEVVAEAVIPSFGRWAATKTVRPLLGTVLFGFVFSLPFSTTYSVVTKRTLDVRLVLRRALQCTLLKFCCATLCMLPFAYVTWLAYSYRDLSIATFAAQPAARIGLSGLLLGASGLFTYSRVLQAIDRRFFGPSYDSRSVIAEFRDRLWSSANGRASAALLAQTVRNVLLTRAASVLLRASGNGEFEDPDVDTVVPADSVLIDLLARSHQNDCPVTEALVASIDDADARWIARTAAAWLVPLRSPDGEILGLLALSDRVNERSYLKEDRSLLADLAFHAGLALYHQLDGCSPSHHTSRAVVIAAAECPRCGSVVPADSSCVCGRCGAPLVRSSLPAVMNGKYRVESRVGRGGMGVVYRARDEALDRTVALKTLPYRTAAGDIRCAAEGRIMAAISHPNLATVYSLELCDGRPVLVMEYLERGTLKDRIGGGLLTMAETVNIGLAICDGLMCLHGEGLVHGDVKPSNIGFAADDTVKLLDFGLTAPQLSIGGSTRPLRGTLQYRCPYQTGDATFASDDLWGLAAVLYESLTRERVFDVIGGAPAPRPIPNIRDDRRQIAPELAALFRRALSSRADVRPRSAQEFRFWLERARPL